MNITVYLGANKGNDPSIAEAARELGSWIGESGNDLVYGGSKVGLMGILAESALNGVLPRFLEGFEVAEPIEIISSSIAATMIVLIIAAIAEPFLVKFGTTKGMRYLMCAFILAGCIDVVILTNFLAPDVMQSILAWIDANSLALFAALTVAALAIYAASCFISIRIFQAKDL